MYICNQYKIYEDSKRPNERATYVGQTPILEQAVKCCENAKKDGKSYFVVGITISGKEVLLE